MKNELNINEINKLFKVIYRTVIGAHSLDDIDRLLCYNNWEKIDLFSVDFFEIKYWSSEDFKKKLDDKLVLGNLLDQVKKIVLDEKESNKRRAEAFVRAYQLLEFIYTLVPKLLNFALKLIPNMPLALVVMGIHYSHIGDKKNAFSYLNKAIEIDPSYPYSWLVKGNFEMNKNNELFCYSEFIKCKPDSEIGYSRRIRIIEDKLFKKIPIKKILDNTKNIKLFIEDNAFLLDLNIYSVNFNNCITLFHNWFCSMSKEKTLNVLDIIINLFQINTTAYWITQVIYANTIKHYDKKTAIEKYSDIINADITGIRLKMYCYYNRSQIYFNKKEKEYEKALNDNNSLLELYPQLPKNKVWYRECDLYDIRKTRINILKEIGDFDKILQEYSLILNELENNEDKNYLISEIYMERARYYKKYNEDEKALEDFLKVIEMGINGFDYSIKDAYAARIEIFKKHGEMEKAFADYITMSELKEHDPFDIQLSSCSDFLPGPKYKILDDEYNEEGAPPTPVQGIYSSIEDLN